MGGQTDRGLAARRTAPHRFAVLDAWRGLAALAVGLYHIRGTSPALSGPLHSNLAAAVDFFFVLSGFVISASYARRLMDGFSLWRFIALRVGRIWPLHAAELAAFVAIEVAHLALDGQDYRGAVSNQRDFAALPATLLLLQAWVYPGRLLWNAQSWSVSVELGLYLGAALLWQGLKDRAALAGFALSILALTALPLTVPQAGDILRGVGGFGLGMTVWRLYKRLPPDRWPHLPVVVLEVGSLPVLLLAAAGNAPVFVLDLLFAGVVLTFAAERGPVSRVLSSSPARLLGQLSYSFYMVHLLVFAAILRALALVEQRAAPGWVRVEDQQQVVVLLPTLPALALAAAMILIALGVGWIGWRLVEWPARAWSRRLVLPSATAGPAT